MSSVTLSRAGSVYVQDQPGRLWWVGLDVAAILLLAVVVTFGFSHAYGPGWVWMASLGGTVLGLGVALLSAWRRWSTLPTAGAAVAAYLLFGSLLAMPDQALIGFLPNGRTLLGLLTGPVTAWKGMLTIEPPIGETDALLVVPLLTLLVAALGAMTISLRSGRSTWAWLPMAAAALLAWGLGTHESMLPIVAGIGLVAVVLIWVTLRRGQARLSGTQGRGGSRWPALASGALVLAIAAGGSVALAGPVAPSGPRQTLRDAVESPINLERYPSPLQRFRYNHSDQSETALMRLTGVPEGAKVRIATLDTYDGITYNVGRPEDNADGSGEFRRVGSRIPDGSQGLSARVSVEILDYNGVWVPTVGQTLSIDFDSQRGYQLSDEFFYNPRTGTGVNPLGLQRGDRYLTEVVVPTRPEVEVLEAAQGGSVALPELGPVPEIVVETAGRWTADAVSGGDIALQLEQQLQQGFYSNGVRDQPASLPGHTYDRVQSMFTEQQMVGDEEQYAVTMALMARAMGLPARVVYGYDTGDGGEVTIQGQDVTAWTEVNLEGLGWVSFFPSPPKDRLPDESTISRQTKPQPQVENPPPPPEQPDDLPPDNTQPDAPRPDDEDQTLTDYRLIGIVTAAVGVPLIFIVAPIALVLGMKAKRRTGRRESGAPKARVAGGWAELVDKATDFNAPLTASKTRSEQAAELVANYPRTREGADPVTLAKRADAAVFGPGEPSARQVEDFWAGIGVVSKQMGRSVGGWRRLRGALSPKSLRRR